MVMAWVTGGGTGIGRALAERLYREGARVVITGRRKNTLEESARQMTAAPGSGELIAIPGDATDPAHLQHVVATVQEKWGPITLLINNAGANPLRTIFDTTLEEYRKALENNCLSAIACSAAVLPSMLKAGGGAIINISSVYGKWASANSAAYSVSKYALAGFTDTLRQTLVGQPIHVMGVYPGFIKTDMTLPFVQPGTVRSYLGKSPDHLARAILKAWRRRQPELYYPWYVPWVLRLHRWMPGAMDRLSTRVRH